MSNVSYYQTPISQKLLCGLSFLSLGYLAIMLYVFSQIDGVPKVGVELNFGMVVTTLCLASLFMYTAFVQLFAQRRKLVLFTLLAAVLGNILHLKFMKFVEVKLQVWAANSAVEGFVLPDPVFPIEAIVLASLPWYLALVFPLITNFRKLPAQEQLTT